MKRFKKFIPLLVILILMLIAYLTGIYKYFTLEELQMQRQTILGFLETHPILTPLFFMLIYIVSVALSLPGATILTVCAGFLFGQPLSTIYVVISATIGATIIFLVAKTAFREFLQRKAGPFLNKLETGFKRNAASYLLFLRFIPLFPFWLVNIAPAFFGVSLFTYLWTTFVGIIPGSFVYAQAGTGLGAILDAGEEFSIDTVFNVQIRIALIALAIFSLIPIVVKKLIKKKHD